MVYADDQCLETSGKFPPVLTTILLPKQQNILVSLCLWVLEEGERRSEGGMILLVGLFQCFKASRDGCKAHSDVRKGLPLSLLSLSA